MKDINVLFRECLQELASIGIRPEPISDVSVNYRAKKRWGQARRNRTTGVLSISVSARLLDDDLPDEPAKNTLMHEMLHCVEGCWSHTGKWKRLAEVCNRELGTRITRCTDYSNIIQNDSSEPRYVVVCTNCGNEFPREKRSKIVVHPENYRCECGGPLKRIK